VPLPCGFLIKVPDVIVNRNNITAVDCRDVGGFEDATGRTTENVESVKGRIICVESFYRSDRCAFARVKAHSEDRSSIQTKCYYEKYNNTPSELQLLNDDLSKNKPACTLAANSTYHIDVKSATDSLLLT